MADMASPNEFDLARNRAAQQNATQVQGQSDAIKRRFAAMNNLNSGAFEKANENVQRDAAQSLTNANEGINAAQTAENRRVSELQANRDFTAQQNQLGREFQSSQAGQARDFQSKERQAAEGYGSTEAGKARSFQDMLSMRDQKFKNAMADIQQTQFGQTLQNEKDRIDLERQAQEFNTEQAKDEAKKVGGIAGIFNGKIYKQAGTDLGSSVSSLFH